MSSDFNFLLLALHKNSTRWLLIPKVMIPLTGILFKHALIHIRKNWTDLQAIWKVFQIHVVFTTADFHRCSYVQFIWVTFYFFYQIHLYKYRFDVYPVERCPMNVTEFEEAARRRKCSGKSRYLCAPDKYLSNLIEFCTDRKLSLFKNGIIYLNVDIHILSYLMEKWENKGMKYRC